MDLKKSGYLFLCFLFCIAQAASAQKSSNPEVLRIDPGVARGGSVSQLIDSMSFIPLESTAESSFGRIDQLVVTDKYFIILDKQTNAVLIFKRNGQLHAKIKGSRIGYTEKQHIYAFYFDKFTNLIQIPWRLSYFYYNTDGKLEKKMKVYQPGIRLAFSKAFLNKNETAYYSYDSDTRLKDSTAFALITAGDSIIHRKYFPYNMKTANLKSRDIFENTVFNPLNDTSVYFLRAYGYLVYILSPDTLYEKYRFIFPAAMMLPANFTTEPSLNYKREQFIQDHKKIIWGLGNFYQIEDELFFKASDYSDNNSYLYNLKSHSLICIDRIYPDEKSYFLPITDAQINVDFKTHSFLAKYQNFLFTSYSSRVLFQQKDMSKNKHSIYPSRLSKYLSNKQNERGNPVIVQMRFKPGL